MSASQSQAGEARPAGRADDPLLECLAVLTRLHGRPVSPSALMAGLPAATATLDPGLFVRAAERQGWSARVLRRALNRISPLSLPAVLALTDDSACVLVRLDADAGEAEIIVPDSGFGSRTLPLDELQARYAGYCLFAMPRPGARVAPDIIDDAPGKSWFWGTLWHFRRYYAEAGAAAVLVNLLTVATALFVMNVYDRVVPNNAFETLTVLAIGTLMAVGFEFIARSLRAYFLDFAGKKADLILASRIFAQALGMRMQSQPGSSGTFAAQVREFESLRDFMSSATMITLTDLPFTFFFIWLVFLIGGPLYLVPLLAVPVVFIAGLIAQWPLSRLMRRNLREMAARHGLLVESINSLATLKALNAEGVVQGRWEEFTALAGNTATRSRFISALVVNFAAMVQQCATVGVVAWGVYLIAAGDLTVGALIACVILTGRGLAPLGQLAGLLTRYQQARASYFMLDELMAREVERPAGRRFLHRPVIHGDIRFENVTFAYPGDKSPALREVSFSIRAGERVAILGRIAAGKSTILRLLLGLYQPASGSISVDGADLEQFDPADLRRGVAWVGQDATLFGGSLRDNVALGVPTADDEAILAAARVAGLDTLVNEHPMGFDLPVGEGGRSLSGGQRQSVAIARAVLTDAPLVLLDEPTSAMDHSTEQQFLARFGQWSRGRTLLLVTHKPGMLNLVDRILVIDRGKLVMDGPREQVLKQLVKQV